MDIDEFRKKMILDGLNIVLSDWGRCMIFLDFGNMNFWFENDDRDEIGELLLDGEKLTIDFEKLSAFTRCFSEHSRFYYGHNPKDEASMGFLGKSKYIFGKKRVFTKEMQFIKHYLKIDELGTNTRTINIDTVGRFIRLPKCNFDVEIAVDAIRLMNSYDTIILFSGDADFVALVKFLRSRGKKVILVKSGHVLHTLISGVDLVINAQDIKKYIACNKAKI